MTTPKGLLVVAKNLKQF